MTEPRLADQLDALAADERRRAVRALLRRPFIVAEADVEIFTLVRRHREALAAWFQAELGYRLLVDSDFARLHKMPAPIALSHRRLETRAGQPFDSRRYVLFCLVLAALEQAGDQTTLERLSEAVKEHASDTEWFDLDFDRVADRRAFTHAVRAVVDLGVLHLRDGDEERFARKEQGGDALYQVRHRRLAQVLSAPLPPSSVADAAAMQAELYPDTSEGRSRRSRHRVMRLLVETAVVHFADLSDDDRAYLTSQRARIFRQLETLCGFELELRAEGVAVIDPSEEATDLAFPSGGTVAHAALVLGEEVVRRARAGDEIATLAEIEAHVAALEERFGKYWSEEYKGDAQAQRRLAEVALDRLEAFALIERTEGGVRPRPSLARFTSKEQDHEPQP
jgi:uncharacterized protein (TIGR02678 family)